MNMLCRSLTRPKSQFEALKTKIQDERNLNRGKETFTIGIQNQTENNRKKSYSNHPGINETTYTAILNDLPSEYERKFLCKRYQASIHQG